VRGFNCSFSSFFFFLSQFSEFIRFFSQFELEAADVAVEVSSSRNLLTDPRKSHASLLCSELVPALVLFRLEDAKRTQRRMYCFSLSERVVHESLLDQIVLSAPLRSWNVSKAFRDETEGSMVCSGLKRSTRST